MGAAGLSHARYSAFIDALTRCSLQSERVGGGRPAVCILVCTTALSRAKPCLLPCCRLVPGSVEGQGRGGAHHARPALGAPAERALQANKRVAAAEDAPRRLCHPQSSPAGARGRRGEGQPTLAAAEPPRFYSAAPARTAPHPPPCCRPARTQALVPASAGCELVYSSQTMTKPMASLLKRLPGPQPPRRGKVSAQTRARPGTISRFSVLGTVSSFSRGGSCPG